LPDFFGGWPPCVSVFIKSGKQVTKERRIIFYYDLYYFSYYRSIYFLTHGILPITLTETLKKFSLELKTSALASLKWKRFAVKKHYGYNEIGAGNWCV